LPVQCNAPMTGSARDRHRHLVTSAVGDPAELLSTVECYVSIYLQAAKTKLGY